MSTRGDKGPANTAGRYCSNRGFAPSAGYTTHTLYSPQSVAYRIKSFSLQHVQPINGCSLSHLRLHRRSPGQRTRPSRNAGRLRAARVHHARAYLPLAAVSRRGVFAYCVLCVCVGESCTKDGLIVDRGVNPQLFLGANANKAGRGTIYGDTNTRYLRSTLRRRTMDEGYDSYAQQCAAFCIKMHPTIFVIIDIILRTHLLWNHIICALEFSIELQQR